MLQWSFYWREDRVMQVEFWTAFLSLCRDTSLGEKVQKEREGCRQKLRGRSTQACLRVMKFTGLID